MATSTASVRDQPDYLAGALLQSLMRPMAAPYTPRLWRTLVFGVITLGVAPLVLLPQKLRNFAARERDQLWHLSRWMREQFGSEADVLDPRTPGLDSAMYVLRLISWLCALLALATIGWFVSHRGNSHELIPASYGYFQRHHHSLGGRGEKFFALWMPLLSVGYAAQWIAVQVHQARVRRFVARFNVFARSRSLTPVNPPPEVYGLRPAWLVGAMGFMCYGILWGIPMMLAGAAQTRYIRYESRWTRQDLAQRVRDVLRQTRPAMALTVPVTLRRKCPRSICQAPLPQMATFCPRCGTQVAAVDRVA